jgi:Ca2+-binding EF-hand superfamily protein
MRFAFSLIGIAAMALVSGASLAQPRSGGPGGGPPDHGGEFADRFVELYDTNKDGKVSVEEIVAEHRRLFGAADVDSNGQLSVDEFRRRGHLFQMVGATSLFDMLDANGDGQLSIDEIAAPSRRWFKRYDANNDGAMEASEVPSRSRRR